MADGLATLVIFGWSRALNNSSFYDPYWSVAPPCIATYFAIRSPEGAVASRQVLAWTLVMLWAARLTCHCLERWRGLTHEDWRYGQLREQTGRAYWLVSLLGIHLFPTVQVFLGCLPLYPALTLAGRPINALDGVAAGVTALGIGIEARADTQLRRFRASPRSGPGAFLQAGLWAHVRHPNYLGEILFWWGVCLFGLAAVPAAWWTVVGPLAITLMFVYISVPLIDTRMAARYPAYAAHMERLPALFPAVLSRTRDPG